MSTCEYDHIAFVTHQATMKMRELRALRRKRQPSIRHIKLYDVSIARPIPSALAVICVLQQVYPLLQTLAKVSLLLAYLLHCNYMRMVSQDRHNPHHLLCLGTTEKQL